MCKLEPVADGFADLDGAMERKTILVRLFK
jgi:hypothetical protein